MGDIFQLIPGVSSAGYRSNRCSPFIMRCLMIIIYTSPCIIVTALESGAKLAMCATRTAGTDRAMNDLWALYQL